MTTLPLIQNTAVRLQSEQRYKWVGAFAPMVGALLSAAAGNEILFLISVAAALVLPDVLSYFSGALRDGKEQGVFLSPWSLFMRAGVACGAIALALCTSPAWVIVAGLVGGMIATIFHSAIGEDYDQSPAWLHLVNGDRVTSTYNLTLPSVILGLVLLRIMGADLFGEMPHLGTGTFLLTLAVVYLMMAIGTAASSDVNDANGGTGYYLGGPYAGVLMQGMRFKRNMAIGLNITQAVALIIGVGMADNGAISHEALSWMVLSTVLLGLLGTLVTSALGNYLIEQGCLEGEAPSVGEMKFGRALSHVFGVAGSPASGYGAGLATEEPSSFGSSRDSGGVSPVSSATIAAETGQAQEVETFAQKYPNLYAQYGEKQSEQWQRARAAILTGLEQDPRQSAVRWGNSQGWIDFDKIAAVMNHMNLTTNEQGHVVAKESLTVDDDAQQQQHMDTL